MVRSAAIDVARPGTADRPEGGFAFVVDLFTQLERRERNARGTDVRGALR
jgi:hypothetical protein